MSGGHLQAMLFVLNRPEPIRQSSLLMVLATGIGHAPALMAGLKALAEESQPPWSSRIQQLRILLSQGQTLSEALTSATGLLPEQTLIAVRVAEESGALKQVLAEEAQRLMRADESGNSVQASIPTTLAWMVALGLVATFLITFIMMSIIPKFKAIFEGFGVELPEVTVTLIEVSDWTMSYFFLIVFPITSLLLYGFYKLVRAHLRYLATGHVLGSERFSRYWTPMILRMLSVVVSTGRSLGDGVHAIQRELVPGRASRQLSGVRQSIYSGTDCWEALRAHGFLKRREVAFLNSTAKTHHLDWGLIHLGRTIERRRERWLRLCVSFVQPVIILLAGTVVGFVVIALFMPIVKLINDIS
ncbi:MAG: type II secretion system F family protein [Planctomycetaceae bacterium]